MASDEEATVRAVRAQRGIVEGVVRQRRCPAQGRHTGLMASSGLRQRRVVADPGSAGGQDLELEVASRVDHPHVVGDEHRRLPEAPGSGQVDRIECA